MPHEVDRSLLYEAVSSAWRSALTGAWRAYSIVNSPLPCVMERRPVLYPNISFSGTCRHSTQAHTVRDMMLLFPHDLLA